MRRLHLGLVDARDDARAVLLHRGEILLHSHPDGAVDVLAHILEGIGDGHGEVIAREVYRGELKGVRVLNPRGSVASSKTREVQVESTVIFLAIKL